MCSDEVIAVDVYNLSVGVGNDCAGEKFGRGSRSVRDRAYGVCFDANMGFPLIADCSHTIYHGTCPGYKNGVIVTL